MTGPQAIADFHRSDLGDPILPSASLELTDANTVDVAASAR
ncbi:MAG: hypothetical protein QOD66_3879 [Solirubrobacteraceae bacterium]|nr:hypothetical protein [Solirubrobacteraceae bacterium]